MTFHVLKMTNDGHRQSFCGEKRMQYMVFEAFCRKEYCSGRVSMGHPWISRYLQLEVNWGQIRNLEGLRIAKFGEDIKCLVKRRKMAGTLVSHYLCQ